MDLCKNIVDLDDRKVIGWCVSENLTTEKTVIAVWNKGINYKSIEQLRKVVFEYVEKC